MFNASEGTKNFLKDFVIVSFSVSSVIFLLFFAACAIRVGFVMTEHLLNENFPKGTYCPKEDKNE